MQSKRKYSKCVRCGRTIDITNQDRDLCNPCADERLDGTETQVLYEQLSSAGLI